MRVRLDEAVCVSAGRCVSAAPLVFDQDEETGLGKILVAKVPADQAARVRQAFADCPSRAITIHDD
jgi:ferredoxin